MTDAPETIWEAQPGPQTALLTCPLDEVCFGGARGGGKTDGALGDFASHAQEHGQHAIGLMIRRQRTELVETIERSKQLYTPLGARFNEQKSMWTFSNGARLRFAYLERDSDANAYQGHGYTRLYCEEAGNFPSPTPVMKMLGTLRSGAGVKPKAILTCNPGGPGHQWVKARYITPAPMGYQPIIDEFVNPWTHKKIQRSRVFIPSFVTDNHFLGDDYIATLQQTGNDNLVKAWLLGDWNIVEGAFFDTWSHRNIVKPFAIPPEWLKFRAADWGFSAPFSMGWYAVAGDDAPDYNLSRGCLVRYREFYAMRPGQPNVGLRLTTEALAERIKGLSGDEKYAYSVIDPAAFAENGGPSIAERFARAGVEFRRGDNRRLGARGAMGGWDMVRHRIGGEDEAPMFVTFSTCVDLIRTLPILQHDPDRPEDLDTKQEDHAADECFVAGTIIATAHGPRAIETLRVGDLVETRQGLKPVEAVFSVGERDVFDLTLSNGAVLTGTGNHPVLVDNTWLPLSALRYGDMLWPCATQSNLKASSITASQSILGSIAGRITGLAATIRFTGQSGKACTDLSRPECTSTTSTAIPSTTTLQTSSLSRREITRGTIGSSDSRNLALARIAAEALQAVSGSLKSFAAMLVGVLPAAPLEWMTSNGHARLAGMPSPSTNMLPTFIARAPAHQPGNMNARSSISPALNAALPASPRTAAPSIAQPSVASVTTAGRQRVFNLTVAEAEEYYANGVLVHNCRYACMSRPWVPKAKPVDPKPRTIHDLTMEQAWTALREPTSRGRI